MGTFLPNKRTLKPHTVLNNPIPTSAGSIVYIFVLSTLKCRAHTYVWTFTTVKTLILLETLDWLKLKTKTTLAL